MCGMTVCDRTVCCRTVWWFSVCGRAVFGGLCAVE